MNRNYQIILALLQKSKREIEIQSEDFDFVSLMNIASKLRETDRVVTLVVGDNLTAPMLDSLVSASADHFNIKFSHPPKHMPN